MEPNTPTQPTQPTQPTTPTQSGGGTVQSIIANFKATNPTYQASQPSPTDWYSGVKAGAYKPQTQTPKENSPSWMPTPIEDIKNAGSNIVYDTNNNAANIVQDLTPSNNKSLSDVATNALDVGGSVAKEIGSFLGNGLNLLAQATTPKPIYDAVASHLQQGIQAVAGTPAAKGILDQWNQFEAKNPQVAKNIGNVINIASLVGGDEVSPNAPSLSEAGNAVKQGAEAAGSMVSDAANGVGDAIKNTPTAIKDAVKAPVNLAENIATPIDQNVKTILQNPLPQRTNIKRYVFASKNCRITNRSCNPV